MKRDIGIADSNANVHITVNPSKTVISGYLVDAESNTRMPGCKKHRHKCRPGCPLDEDINIMVNLVQEEYKNLLKNSTQKANQKTNSIFTDAFKRLTPDDLEFSWAQSTTNNTLKYMQNRVLPQLDSYGDSLDEVAIQKIYEDLVEHAMNNKRSPADRITAERSVRSYLVRIDKILEILYTRNVSLPKCYFRPPTPSSAQAEQIKSLPNIVRLRLAYALPNLTRNGLSLGVAAMFLLGLRTGEACGLQFGDISLYDDFSVTRIGRQNKSTGITNRLKTNASYRYVVGSYFFTALLLKRIKFLCSKGYDIETISTLPIVSQNANYGEFVDSSVLSEYARRILIACGITESAISASRFLLNDDPDTQNPDFTEKDITAYILRRDFASRCGNICGLSTSDIDYLLGHISQNKTIKDYSNFDTQKMLAGMLERAILHPNYTRNPLYLFSQFLPKRKAILPGSQIIFLLPLLI